MREEIPGWQMRPMLALADRQVKAKPVAHHTHGGPVVVMARVHAQQRRAIHTRKWRRTVYLLPVTGILTTNNNDDDNHCSAIFCRKLPCCQWRCHLGFLGGGCESKTSCTAYVWRPSGGDGVKCMLNKEGAYTQGREDAQYTCYPVQASSPPTTTSTTMSQCYLLSAVAEYQYNATFDSQVADAIVVAACRQTCKKETGCANIRMEAQW